MADTLLGRPVWYELVTNDVEGAKQFYQPVIGWTVSAFAHAPSDAPYHVWMAKDNQAGGGLMTIPPGMNWPPHWVWYVGTRELEKTVAAAEKLGAKPLSDYIDVPTVGRLRVMLDPQGAMFALFQPVSGEERPETAPTEGHTAWHELHTTDAEAAMSFYSTLFGWTPAEPMDMGPMGRYYVFARTFPIGGMMNKPKEMAQMPSSWGLYFEVADTDAAARRVTQHGGKILNGPMDVPGGRIVNCIDPQGAAFSLHTRHR